MDDQPFSSREATFAAFADHVSRGKVATFEALGVDLVMGHREGPYFWDAFDGRRFVNCHCNGGVFNLGHRPPVVMRALREALEHLDVGNHHLVSGLRAELARRLAGTTDGRLSGVVFASSGSEAVDLAIKLARAVTGREGIVSAFGAYHGNTGLAAAAGDGPSRTLFGRPLPGFTQVPFDDLEAMDRAIGGTTAAVLLETIPATLGIVVPRDGYLAEVGRLCADRGALLVLDEVQSGLGRTGRIWCHEHDGAEPDMVVTGKGLGAGIYPVAATLATPAVHSFLDDHPFAHTSTFGGAEIGCAVAIAVLDVVEERGFCERVEEVGERFEKAFAPLPFALRRRGLMMGLKFPNEGDGLLAAKACLDQGVFTVFANNDTSVLQCLPPLVLTDEQVEETIGLLVSALS